MERGPCQSFVRSLGENRPSGPKWLRGRDASKNSAAGDGGTRPNQFETASTSAMPPRTRAQPRRLWGESISLRPKQVNTGFSDFWEGVRLAPGVEPQRTRLSGFPPHGVPSRRSGETPHSAARRLAHAVPHACCSLVAWSCVPRICRPMTPRPRRGLPERGVLEYLELAAAASGTGPSPCSMNSRSSIPINPPSNDARACPVAPPAG